MAPSLPADITGQGVILHRALSVWPVWTRERKQLIASHIAVELQNKNSKENVSIEIPLLSKEELSTQLFWFVFVWAWPSILFHSIHFSSPMLLLLSFFLFSILHLNTLFSLLSSINYFSLAYLTLSQPLSFVILVVGELGIFIFSQHSFSSFCLYWGEILSSWNIYWLQCLLPLLFPIPPHLPPFKIHSLSV